jgi:hypothetical protein
LVAHAEAVNDRARLICAMVGTIHCSQALAVIATMSTR